MTVATINPPQLAALGKRGKIDPIDARTPVEFRELHVKWPATSPWTTSTLRRWCRPIWRSGSRGRQTCEKFLAAGFTNVVQIEGGTLACLEAGLPIVRGKKAISLERQVRIAAGSLVLLGVTLGWLVHPALYGLSAFIGAGLVFAGITDTSGMGMMLSRMPWNQVKDAPAQCSTGPSEGGRISEKATRLREPPAG